MTTRVFPRSKQFFFFTPRSDWLPLKLPLRCNWLLWLLCICVYDIQSKRAPKHRFRILDASVFAFYWDKNSVFRPLQIDVSVTTTTTLEFFFSRGRLKLLIRAFTFEDLVCVLISILSLLCVGRKVVSTPRMLADWGWLPLWPGFDSLAWCQLTPEWTGIATFYVIEHKIYKTNSTIYITKNDSHYFLIAQEMLESQICLWCIFVNNLPDKVGWLLKLFETIIFFIWIWFWIWLTHV